jgi:hypothetical protein
MIGKLITGLRVGLGVAGAIALSGSAFASDVAPPNYPFIIKGGGNLSQPSNIWPCGWTFQMKTGPSIGGSPPRASGGVMTGGVGDTNANCSGFTVAPTTWSFTSATTGVFHGLDFSNPSYFFYCSTTADVPFTLLKSGNTITSFYFNFVSFGTNCNFNANLTTGAALTVA